MKITGTHLGVAVVIGYFLMAGNVEADELKFKFKSPSFSGSGTGAHYLTIENQEKSRRDKIKEEIEAALTRAERENDNSTINKFIRNLGSADLLVLFSDTPPLLSQRDRAHFEDYIDVFFFKKKF